MSHDRILILDFGSQVTQLIARRVREAHVYCEVHPNDVSAAFIREFNPKGIILSGSHMSAYEESNDQASPAVFHAGVPVLGICYGMQTMAQQLGGKVESGTKREFGYAEVLPAEGTVLLDGLEDARTADNQPLLKVWMSHGDKVTQLPPGFKVMCSTPSCPIAGMYHEEKRFYALQFHPEVTHTVKGTDMLRRFVLTICGCTPDWVMGDYIAEAVQAIREQVGKEEVILGLSGGVDSSVAAALIHRAIGDQLTCVFVDNGLLRKNEREQVRETFEKNMGLKLIVVDAVDRFMNDLSGITDPETKRKTIGRDFVEIFQEEASKLTSAKWLA
ncbi:bifunctional GMP synthase/glutamine amidotransferase protein, partial [gut metagenome]